MGQLTGSVKVAILTNAIGIKAARSILERLDEEERQIIMRLQRKLGSVPQSLVEKIAREFLEATGGLLDSSPATGKNPGQKEASESAKPEKSDSPRTSLKAIQNLEPNQLLQLIKDEHPQTIALILVHLKPVVASDILSMLPDALKSDVALRIANLDKVISGMVEEIDKVFEDILKNKDHAAIQEAGGVSRLAEYNIYCIIIKIFAFMIYNHSLQINIKCEFVSFYIPVS